ncbi:MAG: VWA domain-containing protein [Acidimicrobiaceae bacterium]|nr:VWA domain-containing protein [Acidimicrobiaceae bacterium]
MTTTEGQELLLFYIVCDESGSMGQNGGIDAINQALPELHATIAADPLAVDKSRLAIIAFSDDAQLILPLAKVTDVPDMPGVQPAGMTNYGRAFELLKNCIESDVEALKAQSYRVYRPCAFFMSDGEPTDDWDSSYRDLMAHKYHPHIVAFGVDGADPTSLSKIATLRCFVGKDRSNAGRALASVMSSIGKTIITTSSTATAGPPDIIVPQQIDGFESVPLEEL